MGDQPVLEEGLDRVPMNRPGPAHLDAFLELVQELAVLFAEGRKTRVAAAVQQ